MILPTIPHDKALHIIAGVLVFAVFHFISPEFGLGMVIAIGIGKEAYDAMSQEHTPEVWDAVATFTGGILGWICHI